MKKYIKPLIALASGPALLSCLFCQTAQAQQVTGGSASSLSPGGSISGTSILADTAGVNYGSDEILTVGWSVAESSGGVYTYDYTVYNPSGDSIETPGDTYGNPEDVREIILDFNTAASGAILPTPPISEDGAAPAGFNEVEWLFGTPFLPTQNSGLLSFTSSLAPSAGQMTASDSTEPSPWSSGNEGGYLPVPGDGDFSVPVGGYYAPIQSNGVPDATNTMTLLAGVLVLLPIGRMVRRKQTS